jgi:hypothetical protein
MIFGVELGIASRCSAEKWGRSSPQPEGFISRPSRVVEHEGEGKIPGVFCFEISSPGSLDRWQNPHP